MRQHVGVSFRQVRQGLGQFKPWGWTESRLVAMVKVGRQTSLRRRLSLTHTLMTAICRTTHCELLEGQGHLFTFFPSLSIASAPLNVP